jgi:hypothetical protein
MNYTFIHKRVIKRPSENRSHSAVHGIPRLLCRSKFHYPIRERQYKNVICSTRGLKLTLNERAKICSLTAYEQNAIERIQIC